MKSSSHIFRHITVLILCLYSSFIWAQNSNKEDSLVNQLNQTRVYEEKTKLLLELVKVTRQLDFKQAILYSNQGEELALDKQDQLMFAKFQLETGLSNYYLGNYDETFKDYFSALKTFEEKNDFIGVIRTTNNIGAVYDRLENYQKASEYYLRCIQFYDNASEDDKQNNLRYLSQIYNNMASAYEKLGRDREAIVYFEKSLTVAEQINFRHIIGSIYNNLGKIEVRNKQFDKARQYLYQAIDIRTEDNEPEGLAKSLYFLSDYYSAINKLDSAEWAAKESLEISEKLGQIEHQQVAQMMLYEIYEKQGKLAQALDAHINYKNLSDSLLNENKMNQLAQLQISYEIDKIEHEAIQEKEKIRTQYTILIIILSAGLVLAFLLMHLYRNQKKRVELENKNLELEIDTKNKELTTNVMYLVQKNELINSVAKNLLSLKENIKEENKRAIQDIIYNLNSESDNEIWQEFEYRFQMVHTDFYHKLRQKHKDITPSEERLAALLRLNLSSKEISTITHQTVRSVEVARGRLRKKLNLTGTDINLVSYLANL